MILIIKKIPEIIIGSSLMMLNIAINIIFPKMGLGGHNFLWIIGSIIFFIGFTTMASRYQMIEKSSSKFIAGIIALVFSFFFIFFTFNAVALLGNFFR